METNLKEEVHLTLPNLVALSRFGVPFPDELIVENADLGCTSLRREAAGVECIAGLKSSLLAVTSSKDLIDDIIK